MSRFLFVYFLLVIFTTKVTMFFTKGTTQQSIRLFQAIKNTML